MKDDEGIIVKVLRFYMPNKDEVLELRATEQIVSANFELDGDIPAHLNIVFDFASLPQHLA